ncbi:AAA family ATPase [bacterium]|nr:AAA family ATPase [bacterium]
MNEISSVAMNVAPKGINNLSKATNVVNFRAKNSEEEQVDAFIKEQEKAQKSAKRQQTFNTIVMATIGAASLGTLALMGHQMGWFKKFKLDFKDLSGEKALKDMALPESQIKAAERITTRIENYAEMIKKGGKKGSAILFYGPPGTGKNTFAYGIAKKFSNAKFIEMDISKMNSKWHGESEQNVLGTMEAAIKYAKQHTNEKIFVFIDEIDSVMMQDFGNGAKLSNDVLNAFKKGFNKLTNQENIIVIGATNLKINPELAKAEGKMLDTAMLDRFSQKVLVDLPTKDQIIEFIGKFYNDSAKGMIDETLKNNKDSRWDKIAEFLSDPIHSTSFRKLTDIFGIAAESTKVGKNVTFEEIANAIKENKHNLNATDSEIEILLNSLK